jgi:hypothetical protein
MKWNGMEWNGFLTALHRWLVDSISRPFQLGIGSQKCSRDFHSTWARGAPLFAEHGTPSTPSTPSHGFHSKFTAYHEAPQTYQYMESYLEPRY